MSFNHFYDKLRAAQLRPLFLFPVPLAKLTLKPIEKYLAHLSSRGGKPTATRFLASMTRYLELKGTTGKGTYYVIKGLTKGSNPAD